MTEAESAPSPEAEQGGSGAETAAERKRRRILVVGGLSIALALQAVFAVAYIGALHAPRPHEVPIGVLDEGTAAAVQAAGGGGAFRPVLEESPAAIQRALQDRDIAGALVDGKLYVASGGSSSTARFLTTAIATQDPRIEVVDIAPLSAGDSQGLTLFYSVLAWGFGAYFAATLVTALVGAKSRTHRAAAARVAALAVYSVLAGFIGALIADQAFDAIEGHYLSVAGIGMLVSFAVAAATAALQSALGVAGTLVALVVFVMFGNASAGGAYQSTFVPGFWRAIGEWLPAGAGLEALRGAVYFDGRNITQPMLVLAFYALVGSVVTVGLAWRRGLRAPELEMSTAAAA